MSKITIGNLSKQFGISTRMIRHYEDIGLLNCTRHTETKYRFYSNKDIERLEHILLFKQLGFSLDEIQSILALLDDDKLVDTLSSQLRLMESKIAELNFNRNVLKNLLRIYNSQKSALTIPQYHWVKHTLYFETIMPQHENKELKLMSVKKKSNEELLKEEIDRVYTWQLTDKISLLKALEKRFGPEVKDIIVKDAGEREIERFRREKIGPEDDSNTLENCAEWFCGLFRSHGMKYTITKKEDGITAIAYECPMHNHAVLLNEKDWMYYLHCAGEQFVVQAYNPEYCFNRTKCMMKGDEYCEFHFANKPD